MKLIAISLFIVIINSTVTRNFPEGTNFKSQNIYIGSQLLEGISAEIKFKEGGIYLDFENAINDFDFVGMLEKSFPEGIETKRNGSALGFLAYQDVYLIHFSGSEMILDKKFVFDIQIIYLKAKICTIYGIILDNVENVENVKKFRDVLAALHKIESKFSADMGKLWGEYSSNPLSKYSNFYIHDPYNVDVQFKNTGLVNIRLNKDHLERNEMEFKILFFDDSYGKVDNNDAYSKDILQHADQNLYIFKVQDRQYRYYSTYILTIDFAQITGITFKDNKELSIRYYRPNSIFNLVATIQFLNVEEESKFASYVAIINERIKNKKFLNFFSIIKMLSQLEELKYTRLLEKPSNEHSIEPMSRRSKTFPPTKAASSKNSGGSLKSSKQAKIEPLEQTIKKPDFDGRNESNLIRRFLNQCFDDNDLIKNIKAIETNDKLDFKSLEAVLLAKLKQFIQSPIIAQILNIEKLLILDMICDPQNQTQKTLPAQNDISEVEDISKQTNCEKFRVKAIEALKKKLPSNIKMKQLDIVKHRNDIFEELQKEFLQIKVKKRFK
jgi:hypothetical protein